MQGRAADTLRLDDLKTELYWCWATQHNNPRATPAEIVHAHIRQHQVIRELAELAEALA